MRSQCLLDWPFVEMHSLGGVFIWRWRMESRLHGSLSAEAKKTRSQRLPAKAPRLCLCQASQHDADHVICPWIFCFSCRIIFLIAKILLQQLIRPDITCHSLWSPHPSLVSRDILDTAIAERDVVDGHTSRKQRMCLGRSIIIPQHRINPQCRGCHLQEVGSMCLVRSKHCVLCILDQVIALRGERALNVWTSGRLVPCDKAISHHQLASAVGQTVPDT